MTFFRYPIATIKLIDIFIAAFCRIRGHGTSIPSDREYTRAIREALACASNGSSRGFEVYPDRAKGNRECGYDVSWWIETEDRLELVLAAESEWNRNRYGVKYDFEKIIPAKCPLKVIITDSRGKVERMRSILERSLRRYKHHISGERYVWIDVERAFHGGRLRPFECQINTDGASDSLSFKPIAGEFPYALQTVL